MMNLAGKRLIWLLLVPPGAAIVMGVLMLQLALNTDPGVIEPTAQPLSKTSWRAAQVPVRSQQRPGAERGTVSRPVEREGVTP